MADPKITCSVCAWRENCKKKFSIIDPAKCIDFSKDITIKIKDKENETASEN